VETADAVSLAITGKKHDPRIFGDDERLSTDRDEMEALREQNRLMREWYEGMQDDFRGVVVDHLDPESFHSWPWINENRPFPEDSGPVERVVTVEHAVRVLQRAFEADPEAMRLLFSTRTRCNEELSRDPSIQVAKKTEHDMYSEHGEPYSLGFMGLLNGIFGVDEERWGAIAAKISMEEDPHPVWGRYRLDGFEDNGRKVVPE
jgi:hypothetical protein